MMFKAVTCKKNTGLGNFFEQILLPFGTHLDNIFSSYGTVSSSSKVGIHFNAVKPSTAALHGCPASCSKGECNDNEDEDEVGGVQENGAGVQENGVGDNEAQDDRSDGGSENSDEESDSENGGSEHGEDSDEEEYDGFNILANDIIIFLGNNNMDRLEISRVDLSVCHNYQELTDMTNAAWANRVHQPARAGIPHPNGSWPGYHVVFEGFDLHPIYIVPLDVDTLDWFSFHQRIWTILVTPNGDRSAFPPNSIPVYINHFDVLEPTSSIDIRPLNSFDGFRRSIHQAWINFIGGVPNNNNIPPLLQTWPVFIIAFQTVENVDGVRANLNEAMGWPEFKMRLDRIRLTRFI